MHALIDGDIILYRIGFGHQKMEDDVLVVSPISWVLKSVDQYIEGVLDALNTDEFTMYISGPDNFRVDEFPTYKANRKDAQRPHYYQEIKDYLIQMYQANVSENCEADDEMAMAQWADYEAGMPAVFDNERTWDTSTCICTIDKDLDGVPGWHYNPVRKEKYWVDEWTAMAWFYAQLAMGDKVDNITGIPKVGPKKAGQLLLGCETEYEMYQAVLTAYNVYYGQKGLPEGILEENAHQLYMIRERGKRWRPPINEHNTKDQTPIG